MARFLQVLTTTATRADAERIAQAVVQQRLAACAQVQGPIASTYWWEGAMETAEEWECRLKTREDAYPRLEAAIRAAHPYQMPQIVAVPIQAGLAAYLDWIDREVAPPAASD